ncbi:MAG: aminotransferase class I/II-fold pyridoxal phosphate-dependent enzyme, partial [Bacteroidetes bacterium]
AVSAEINSVQVKQVPLLADFQIDMQAVWAQITPQTKIIFLCSPNNPTGNILNSTDVFALLQGFRGIVVIDEAYIDFSAQESWAGKLGDFPQLVVLRTFSKAWGLAALRIGMALACPRIIALLNKVKPPYNLNVLTQAHLKHTLENNQTLPALVQTIITEREKLAKALKTLSIVETVYASEANFLLVRFRTEAKTVYQALTQKGIVVRDRSTQISCERCLRITVGTAEENNYLLAVLHEL